MTFKVEKLFHDHLKLLSNLLSTTLECLLAPGSEKTSKEKKVKKFEKIERFLKKLLKFVMLKC